WMGWLVRHGQKEKKQDQLLKELRPKTAAAPTAGAERALWDWYYLQLARQDSKETYEAAKVLGKLNDPAGQWVYLTWLGNRTLASGPRVVRRARANMGMNEVDNTPPLPDDELKHVLACYQNLRRLKPDRLAQGPLAQVSV